MKGDNTTYILGCRKSHDAFLLCFSVIYSYKEQQSINNILPVLFDNLLPSFSKLHNSLFIEGPVLNGEKLNKVLIYGLIRSKRYTMQGILKSVKQMEI